MFNFFVTPDKRQGDTYFITDGDYNHIKNVLRMKEGETFLVSCEGKSDLCNLDGFVEGGLYAKIIEENYQSTELSNKFYLFQGLPKSDKMELIIQKAVELGVFEIVPFESARSIVKIEEKKKASKIARWQSISESAAKQSKRNVVPKINDILSFKNSICKAKELDTILIAYENAEGMVATKKVLSEIKSGESIGIFIGPEGGFEETEVAEIEKIGGKTISLGKRILRTETAAITAISMLMLHCEMNIEDKEND